RNKSSTNDVALSSIIASGDGPTVLASTSNVPHTLDLSTNKELVRMIKERVDEEVRAKKEELEAELQRRVTAARQEMEVGIRCQVEMQLRDEMVNCQKRERLNQDRSSKKQQYDTKKMNFTASATKLEQTIKKLQSELSTLNSTCADQEIEKADMEDFFTKVKSNPNYAEDLVTKISETEEETKKLKEELTNVKKMEVDNAKQMKIWNSLKKLLECKIQIWHEANKTDS
uniref:Uncharacterized protein n=1 Tax=Romanomermis culicivorax TaxID=13658 RepID=A0A915L643_ROMCU